jgi:hypothetical protein
MLVNSIMFDTVEILHTGVSIIFVPVRVAHAVEFDPIWI